MSSEKEAGNLLTSENAADFYSQKLGLAVEAPVEAVEQTPEPTEEAPQSEPEAIEEATQPEERKQNPKLEKRFSEITKQREAARQEAQREREAREALEARLRDLEAKVAPQAPAKWMKNRSLTSLLMLLNTQRHWQNGAQSKPC